MAYRFFNLLFFALFTTFLIGVTPSNVYSQTKAIKKAEKNKENQKKSTEESEAAAKKRHLKIQKKETRKRMKRSMQEADRRKRGLHPVPWYRRIFRFKKRTKRAKDS